MSKRHIQKIWQRTFCGRAMHPADMTTISAHRDGVLVADCKQCIKALKKRGNKTWWIKWTDVDQKKNENA